MARERTKNYHPGDPVSIRLTKQQSDDFYAYINGQMPGINESGKPINNAEILELIELGILAKRDEKIQQSNHFGIFIPLEDLPEEKRKRLKSNPELENMAKKLIQWLILADSSEAPPFALMGKSQDGHSEVAEKTIVEDDANSQVDFDIENMAKELEKMGLSEEDDDDEFG